MERRSQQRELIFQLVKSYSLDHPTAAEIYEAARRELPRISLGTVYRNLGLLVAKGELLSFRVGESVHYDATTSTHQHFVCNQCGCILDLTGDPVAGLIHAAEQQGLRVEKVDFLMSGLCHNCAGQQSQ